MEGDYTILADIEKEAKDFLNNTTKPFIEFIEDLMKEKREKDKDVREHSRQ